MRTGDNIGILDLQTRTTFRALVQMIIQPIEYIASTRGAVQVEDAVLVKVYEYVIWTLDHSLAYTTEEQLNLNNSSMSTATARLLNTAAAYLIQSGQAKCPLDMRVFTKRTPFTYLSRSDRLRVITLLDCLDINLASLPTPYTNNPGLIRNMMDVLNQLTLFGYYSEWTAYGTTRFLPPDNRRLEYFPIGWCQSNYPGVAFGYRDLRGFLLKYPHKRSDHNG
ncbi:MULTISPECIES: hypothetical protein [Metabacillus]|uniref:Uncharacterized protein n=2 Tax=Metabacillus TaxID=2675233 RepID=A0A179T2X6_9BACI|nr:MULTISPECIES: hypothetical protein [Metabacillus]OAS86853.1 hypothetical protein A6K24_04965 [Metabacillus litoralis]QNF29072.1 hypothetical protein HUW50_17240 [Metabacillus sp. KUDC1714]